MNATVAAALNAGLQAHRAGQLSQAIAAYGAVLAAAPTHPTANHLRGFAQLQLDRPAEAVEDLTNAVRADPANANAWGHLAVCHDRMARSGAAAGAARRAIALVPSATEALGVLSGDPDGGRRATEWLLATAPDDPAAWTRGGLERAERDRHGAIRCLRRSQILLPGDVSTRLDLVDLTRRDKAPERALRMAGQCLVMRPNDPRGLSEHAAAAVELDAVDIARGDTTRALLLAPAAPQAWGNRAEIYYLEADYPAAVQAGNRANLASPTDPDVLANLAAYRLATGDLAGGWPLFRSRPARRCTSGPDLPRWDGETGVRLLVQAEQGLGDELLFSTMWRDLNDRVADGRLAGAAVEADPRLVPLGARALPHLLWRRRQSGGGDPIEATHWCLAGDLAEILRPEIDRFPGAGPGLEADADRTGHWQRWLKSVGGGRRSIGICWRSGSLAGVRRRYYPAFSECASLLALEDSFFVVLQYDDCVQEIANAALGSGSDLVIPPDLDRRGDQENVAALMQALDLVVSADTAVLALAGALGMPTIGFAVHPGWVGLGQAHHPWFPQVDRVYRGAGMDWRVTMETVAARVRAALAP